MRHIYTESLIIFFIIVFVAVFITTQIFNEKAGEEVIVEKRNYVSTDVEECTRIQILCVSDRKYFSDQTGCGCELVSDNDGQKSFCSDQSRNADACIEIYQPVCGFPINQTFSNFCFACINENVLYHTPGECPK